MEVSSSDDDEEQDVITATMGTAATALCDDSSSSRSDSQSSSDSEDDASSSDAEGGVKVREVRHTPVKITNKRKAQAASAAEEFRTHSKEQKMSRSLF